MTREEAIAKAETGWWKNATPREIVAFQLYEDLLCMPFGDFHGAVESALGRSVWTHEFAGREHLQREFESGQRETLNPLETLERVAPGKAATALVLS
jgi:hypothetical protein